MVVRRTVPVVVFAMLLGLLLGSWSCSKMSKPQSAPTASVTPTASDAAPRCFTVSAKDNSPSTETVFHAKHCQAGGVTWAAILDALVQRRGTTKPVAVATPGWTGDVRTLSSSTGNTVRVSVDEEGDAAVFCADSDALTKDIRADIERLNGRAADLEQVMGEANPRALECE